jgi:D-alanyl-D-alanine carboxypeptidase/D-alanyl-D-alanine-endopeptidase (penicillin-binding protein 4)
VLALTHTIAFGAELPRTVVQALKAAGIPPRSASAVLHDVEASRPSLAVRADTPLNPASLMKLVTTYAALELLTPAFRWKTEAFTDGVLEGDVLQGRLLLRGSGDPKLDYESFWILLRSLRSRGIREIRGDIVVDRSYFLPSADDHIDDDAFRPYNVPPDALLVNYKAVRFVFLPDLVRNSVRIYAEPALPGMELVNTLSIVERSCPEGRAFRDIVSAAFQSQPPRASFTGVYPASCGERDLNVALHAPDDYLAAMIRHLWGELGGRWVGELREGLVPEGARLLHIHESRPLGEITRDINKFSNNVMARQLYLTLAAVLGGPPARPENGERAIRQWMEGKRLHAPELRLENGSGLSRTERISARNLAALLHAAWHSPVMPEFVSGLPVAALDGTMRKRLYDHPVAGRAHVKTGLLSDVRAVAGYVLDRRGRRRVAVMIVNHPKAHDAQEALDAFLVWAYAGSKGPARPTSRPPAASPRGP